MVLRNFIPKAQKMECKSIGRVDSLIFVIKIQKIRKNRLDII